MSVFLETERLRLRDFDTDDIGNLLALDSDPDVLRWTNPGGVCAPRAEYEERILPAFIGYGTHSPGFGYWAVIEKAAGRFLGWFHFRPARDGSGDIELGYRLLPIGRGLGLATEGARALIRQGFTELGVRRVVATALEDNAASRRVMEKAGLGFVEAFTYPSLGLPGVKYALDKATWEERQADKAA